MSDCQIVELLAAKPQVVALFVTGHDDLLILRVAQFAVMVNVGVFQGGICEQLSHFCLLGVPDSAPARGLGAASRTRGR